MTDRQTSPCPRCDAPITIPDEPGVVHCDGCGAAHDLSRVLCPDCGLVNPAGRRSCAHCRGSLVRTCPHCDRESWAGAELCAGCGRPIDLLERMTQARVRDARQRMLALQQDALQIKQRETAEAEARMAHFRELERQRLAAVQARAARQQEQQRRTLGAILLATLVVFLLVSVVLLALYLRGP